LIIVEPRSDERVHAICALRGRDHGTEFLSEDESVALQRTLQAVDLNVGRFAMGGHLATCARKRSNENQSGTGGT
jgi:hypothetical protein